MQQAALGLGSNQGDKERHLRLALENIDRLTGTGILRVSRFYRTAPVGKTDQDWFVNAAVLIETGRTPLELLDDLLDIERDMGRVRTEKWGPRNIDLDILFYDRTIIDEPRLIVPHPYLHQRLFVLYPLRDIAPEWRHPRLGHCPDEMIAGLPREEQEIEVLPEDRGRE